MRPSTYPAHLNMHKKGGNEGQISFCKRDCRRHNVNPRAWFSRAAARVWCISDLLIDFMTDGGKEVEREVGKGEKGGEEGREGGMEREKKVGEGEEGKK